MTVNRGDVYFASLDPVVGSEQGGTRPVVIIQNSLGNMHSPTVVAAITSKNKKPDMPTHVQVLSDESVLYKDSIIMLEQVRTIDKSRLLNYMGRLDDETMKEIDRAYLVSLGCTPMPERKHKTKTEEQENNGQK